MLALEQLQMTINYEIVIVIVLMNVNMVNEC